MQFISTALQSTNFSSKTWLINRVLLKMQKIPKITLINNPCHHNFSSTLKLTNRIDEKPNNLTSLSTEYKINCFLPVPNRKYHYQLKARL